MGNKRFLTEISGMLRHLIGMSLSCEIDGVHRMSQWFKVCVGAHNLRNRS